MRKLIFAGKCELQRNAESLDRHDGDGADRGADGQVDERVLLAVDRRNLVDHDGCENGNCHAVQEET